MRITVQFQKKVKGDEEYSSLSYNVGFETEPPPEVAQDRTKLKTYVEELFAECKARVEDQIGDRRAATVPAHTTRPPAASASRAAPGRNQARAIRTTSPRQKPGDDSHEPNGQGASPKQINFLRSLGQQGGLSYGQLSALAEETCGKRDLRQLTKKEASALIDQLRSEAA